MQRLELRRKTFSDHPETRTSPDGMLFGYKNGLRLVVAVAVAILALHAVLVGDSLAR